MVAWQKLFILFSSQTLGNHCNLCNYPASGRLLHSIAVVVFDDEVTLKFRGVSSQNLLVHSFQVIPS